MHSLFMYNISILTHHSCVITYHDLPLLSLSNISKDALRSSISSLVSSDMLDCLRVKVQSVALDTDRFFVYRQIVELQLDVVRGCCWEF